MQGGLPQQLSSLGLPWHAIGLHGGRRARRDFARDTRYYLRRRCRQAGKHRSDGERKRRTRNDRGRQDGDEGAVPQSRHLRDRSRARRFSTTVHELLVVPETGLAYVPIFGDGIHGRNPNPGHLLCVFDLNKRAHVADIDLRPYIAPHTLKLGPDGLIYITCENSAVVAVIDRTTNKVVDAIEFRLDQRPSTDHLAGRPAALYRERGRRHGLGDRPAEAKAPRQDQDSAPARRHRDLGRRPHRGRGRRRRAGAVPDRHRKRTCHPYRAAQGVSEAAQIARYARTTA